MAANTSFHACHWCPIPENPRHLLPRPSLTLQAWDHTDADADTDAGRGPQVAVAVSDGMSYYLLVGNNYRVSLVLSIDLTGCAPHVYCEALDPEYSMFKP